MTNYISIVLNSKFPQGKLLNPFDFINYGKNRDLYTTIKELEFYDKHEILRPVLRMNSKYKAIDTYGFTVWNKEGKIELSKEGDFKPWINYNTEKLELYYHPFQIIILDFLKTSRFSIIDLLFQDNIKSLESIKNDFFSKIILLKNTISKSLNFRIGLLMLLNDAYGPFIQGFQINTLDRTSYYERWTNWRKNNFRPHDILKQSNLLVEEIYDYYKYLALYVKEVDPLYNWQELLSIIKPHKK